MTEKIEIDKATDAQINAAIARLNGWIHVHADVDFQFWFHEDTRRVLDNVPDYLHNWALCGPLLSSIVFELKHWPVLHTKYAITIWKDNKTEWLNKLEFIAVDERRVRCLAFLATHRPARDD